MEFIFIFVACPQVCVCPRHGLSIRRIGSAGILFMGGCRRMCHRVMLFRGVKSYLCGRCPARLAFTSPAGVLYNVSEECVFCLHANSQAMSCLLHSARWS